MSLYSNYDLDFVRLLLEFLSQSLSCKSTISVIYRKKRLDNMNAC